MAFSGPSAAISSLKIEQRPVSELSPNPRNARTHSRKQITKIQASIQRFGFTNPILIDETGMVLAGHGRLDAAKELRLKQVPTIRIDHLSDAEKRAYVIADNKLAQLSGWDQEILALELGELLDLNLEFDIGITGFETPEIDLILESQDRGGGKDPLDEMPPADEKLPPTSRVGDLWHLGKHRLLCADARDPSAFARLMDG